MIKAVDGGDGGRGIRLVSHGNDLPSMLSRAVKESPSKRVLAEKAAVEGYRHIEVQIYEGSCGNRFALWKRECSVQR